MSKPKYLYIDDENDSSIESIRDGFNDVGVIEVELYPLEKTPSFEELRNKLISMEFVGLIIDLRLDGNGPNKVGFSATTLAQDLRTIQARTELKTFPIVLCSTLTKIRETYNTDKASHDLFDYTFEKSEEPNYEKFSQKLNSLANWYSWLGQSKKNIHEVLNREDLNDIDSRIYEDFLISDSPFLPNDYARFIINSLFHHPGALIKERTLAARLGIDIEKSSDWNELKDSIFATTSYSGLFSDGWKRWWSDKVIQHFMDFSDGQNLASLNAEQRVIIIIAKTGLKGLVPAEPIELCVSTEFWTICEGHKRPLDPLEGLVVYENSEIKPWQENKYISFHAAEVERIGRDKGLRPHPSENERIEEIKESLQS